MRSRALQGTHLLAAAVFVASTLVLALQLVNPSPVVVSVGEDGGTVTELSGQFTYRDVAVVAVSACLFGASATYLLTAARAPTGRERSRSTVADGRGDRRAESEADLEASLEAAERMAERLADTERAIFEAVIDAEGEIPQTDLVEETDLSKATVSRSLDKLERKELVERKRRGMGNVVVLV